MSYDWAQPIALNIAIAADIHKNIKSGKAASTGVLGTAVDSLAAGIETVVEQPLFKGIQTIFGSTYGDDKLAGLKKVLEDVPASFVPTFLNQIRQAMDNTAREPYDPNPLQRALNRGIAKLPFVASRLPEAYTTLGQPREMYRGGTNSLFNVFLNPAFVEKYNVSPEIEMVLAPFQKEDRKEQFPRRTPKKIAFDDKEYQLAGSDIGTLQRVMGRRTEEGFANLDTDAMRKLSSEDQEKKMAAIVEDAWEETRRGYLERRGVDIYTPFRREQFKEGLTPAQIEHNVGVQREVDGWKLKLKRDPAVQKLSDEEREPVLRSVSEYLGGFGARKDDVRSVEVLKRGFTSAKSKTEEFLRLKTAEVAPEVTTQMISVPVFSDRLTESNENFVVNLTAPTNAVLGRTQAQGTITDTLYKSRRLLRPRAR